jgi:hypothetical protein
MDLAHEIIKMPPAPLQLLKRKAMISKSNDTEVTLIVSKMHVYSRPGGRHWPVARYFQRMHAKTQSKICTWQFYDLKGSMAEVRTFNGVLIMAARVTG